MIPLTLVVGLLVSVAGTAVVLASWYFHPETWIADATEGEQKTPVTPATVSWTVLTFVVLIGGPVVAAWFAATDHAANFGERALVAYGVFVLFNLWDLIVIDIAIYVWLRPSWMTIEGVEIHEGYGMHVKGFLNGLAIGVPVALMAAAVSMLA
ncbi:MAG: hypothetical protein AAGE98_02825 [Actinomycetota bacterium]